jgi:hypothetical protein
MRAAALKGRLSIGEGLSVKTKLLVAAGIVAYLAGLGIADAKSMSISGCARSGFLPFCIVMKSGGKTYNITAAKPLPRVGTYGTVTGTLTNKVSLCGSAPVIDPAKWQADPTKVCTFRQ